MLDNVFEFWMLDNIFINKSFLVLLIINYKSLQAEQPFLVGS